MISRKKILSLQSHVVYGYVGNKAITYPLQSLNYDVLPLNTVQFSNHTGYGQWSGDIASAEILLNIVDKLAHMNFLDDCAGILSGYMGSRGICDVSAKIVQIVKNCNPEAVYLCDPVMGSAKGCFVANEVKEFFCNFPSADIITPNAHEVEILTGIKLSTMQDTRMAIEKLFDSMKDVSIIAITGVRLSRSNDGFQKLANDSCYESYIAYGSRDGDFELYRFDTMIFVARDSTDNTQDNIGGTNGAGDLFSALLLGYYIYCKDSKMAVKSAINALAAALNRTIKSGSRELNVLDIDYSRFYPDFDSTHYSEKEVFISGIRQDEQEKHAVKSGNLMDTNFQWLMDSLNSSSNRGNFYKRMMITDLDNPLVIANLDGYLEYILDMARNSIITSIQLRSKNMAIEDFESFGKQLINSLRDLSLPIPVIVNDHLNICLKIDADGLHLGQNDGDIAFARKELGEEKILGLSVDRIDQIKRANESPIDYIGVGPVFPTSNKDKPVIGVGALKEIVAHSRHRAIAIGGISKDNIQDINNAGVDGIAAINAFSCRFSNSVSS